MVTRYTNNHAQPMHGCNKVQSNEFLLKLGVLNLVDWILVYFLSQFSEHKVALGTKQPKQVKTMGWGVQGVSLAARHFVPLDENIFEKKIK